MKKSKLKILGLLMILSLSTALKSENRENFSDITGRPTPEYKFDIPTLKTAQKMKDELFYQRATQMYLWGLPAVGMQQYRIANQKAMGGGSDQYKVGYLGGLMKTSLKHLTGNPDSMYIDYFFDTHDGPIVFEVPETLPGMLDDMWERPVGDIIPATSPTGKYLIVPPGWEGTAPKGYAVLRPKTYVSWLLLRGPVDVETGNTDKAVSEMKKIKIYPLSEYGKPYVNRLKFYDITDADINRIPPEGLEFFEVLNKLVQDEYVEMQDPYILGTLAAIGIEKGKPFNPDEKTKRLLKAGAQTGEATARSLAFDFNNEKKLLWEGRHYTYAFADGKPDFIKDSKALLDARTSFFYAACGTSNLMATMTENVGQAYPSSFQDKNGDILDGGKTYVLHLPKGIPAKDYWSVTIYDNATRSEVENGLVFSKLSSFDKPAVNSDGSIDIYFGPKAPAGKERNFVKTVPNKGWFFIFRLYGPEKAYFDKTWIPDDVVEVKNK